MLTPAPHIRYATAQHGTAVLDIRHGTWIMLGPHASQVWRAVTARGGTDGLADEIAVPTGQDPAAVDGHITEFVTELVDAGVLVDADRPAPRRRRWWR